MRKKVGVFTKYCFCLLIAASLFGSAVQVQASKMANSDQKSLYRKEQKKCIALSELNLRQLLRELWVDHILWTRSYVVSALAGLEDREDVLARLLKNQQDIGNAIKPFYGEKAGNELARLLREHILTAGQLVEAVKQNNQADIQKYDKIWHQNADRIAAFLSEANPHWPEKELRSLLYEHLRLLTHAVVARANKDWKADIKAFDQGQIHILKLADFLSEGMIKQFPDRFRK